MLDETRSSTRREFTLNGLQSLVAMALIEGLWSSRLFGGGVAPLLDQWFKDINEISKDVHDHNTKSDHKDNVHWVMAESDTGFIFNVHVVETDPENKKPGRVYVDPMGEKVAGGLIKAPKITYGKVNQLHG